MTNDPQPYREIIAVTPRVRFALWLTDVSRHVQKYWSLCPATDIAGFGVKLTVTQHGPHSYTLTAYARSNDAAFEEIMGAIERQERFFGAGSDGVGANLDAVKASEVA